MRYLFLFICFFYIPFPILPSDKLEDDPVFKEIKAKLNSNWKLYTKKNLFIIERKEPVIVMPERMATVSEALDKTEKEKQIRIKKFGMKMKPNIIYKFQPRWNVNDAIQADLERENLQNQINKLPEKYKIEHLMEKDFNQKGNRIYVPKTKPEKKRVKAYFNEKSKLEKKIPVLPDYHFENFSLFFISKKGMINEYMEVYPESVTGEFIQVQKLLIKYKVNK